MFNDLVYVILTKNNDFFSKKKFSRLKYMNLIMVIILLTYYS